jgi:hypothetical protein
MPLRTQARISPATIMDLPTLEPVPCIMMALVIKGPLSFWRKLTYIARVEKGDDRPIARIWPDAKACEA